MTTKYFYQNLTSFSRFSSVVKDWHFHAVPDDWFVIITDVKSSTKAIESGRYKDVNMIGAASIVAAHNVMNGLSFPYIFGGDGATFLIPPEYEKAMSQELTSLQSLCTSQFGLELRAGKVRVSEIREEGEALDVAKFSLAHKKSIAFFRGGGVSLAENKVKSDEENYKFEINTLYSPNLEKLSCRWKPIPSRAGTIISLIVVSKKKNDASVYENIIETLNRVYKGSLTNANPVSLPALEYKSVLACYRAERSLHKSVFSIAFIQRLLQIFCSVFIFNFDLLKEYRQSIRTHSDYRKFDDMLRLVIDCNDSQAALVHKFLDTLYRNGEVYYGLHESKNALITCFLDGIEEGEHIHFIDGDNGGYAMAAKRLKEQVRKSEKERTE